MRTTLVSSLLLSLASTSLASSELHSFAERQAPGVIQCAANTFEDVPIVLKACNFVTLYNITVPAGQTLDLSAAKPNSVIFFGREIKFGYKKWKGPLVSFKGNQGLYVNLGTSNLLAAGERYWGNSGDRPVVLGIDGVSNTIFSKINITSSPYTAINVKNSKNLIFQRPVVVNLGKGDKNVGMVINSSQNITVTNGIIITQADGIDISSGSGISVMNTNLTFTGLSIGSATQPAVVSNVAFSGIRITGANTAISVAGPPSAGSVSGVSIANVTLIDIAGTAIEVTQPASSAGGLSKIAFTGINGNITSTGRKYDLEVKSCSSLSFTGVFITGSGQASTCSCTTPGFLCQ